MKQRVHYYARDDMCDTACGYKCRWTASFTECRMNVTCGNCKRTKLYKAAKCYACLTLKEKREERQTRRMT